MITYLLLYNIKNILELLCYAQKLVALFILEQNSTRNSLAKEFGACPAQ